MPKLPDPDIEMYRKVFERLNEMGTDEYDLIVCVLDGHVLQALQLLRALLVERQMLVGAGPADKAVREFSEGK